MALGIHSSLSILARLAACAFLIGFVGADAYAAKKEKAAKEKAKKDESVPELISRTGGGETWSDVKELKAAADKGNARAKTQLGDLKLLGEQVEKDIPGGLALLEEAARAGEAPAAFRLGKVYDDGTLVPRDRARGFAYYRAAAAAGSPEAFYNLGASYASGRGMSRDYVEALAWLILARKHGIVNDGERDLRAKITAMKKPQWIPAAEKRAEELAKELEERKVSGLLPPAPGTEGAMPAAPKPSPTPVPAPVLPPIMPGKAPVTRDQPTVIPPIVPPPALPKP